MFLKQCVLRPLTTIDRWIRLIKKTNEFVFFFLWISSQGNLEVFIWQCLDFPKMQTDAGPLLTLKPPCEYNGKPQAFPLRVSSGACNWKALWIDRLHSMCSLSGQHSYWSEGGRLEMYQDQGEGTALAVQWLRLRTSNTGVQVRSLVREPRFHLPQRMPPKNFF